MAATKVDLTTDPECCLLADQTAAEITDVMTSALTGADKEKTTVEHVRDANGKLLSVIIDFKDVPASDKRAAEEAIARNNGVATVQTEPVLVYSQAFDAFAAGLLPDVTPAEPNRHTYNTNLNSIVSAYGSAGAASLTVEANGVSSPNSLEQKLAVPGGSSSGYAFGYVVNQQGLPGGGGGTESEASEFYARFRFMLPSNLLGVGTTGTPVEIRLLCNGLMSGQDLVIRWLETVDTVTPPATMPLHEIAPILPGGLPAGLALPVDGAWHTASFYGRQVGTTIPTVEAELAVDGVKATVVFAANSRLFAPSYADFRLRAATMAGAYTAEWNLDDIGISYKLL